MCCIYAIYEVIRSYKEEAMEQTQQKLHNKMTHVTFISNDWCDLDLGPSYLEMDHATS